MRWIAGLVILTLAPAAFAVDLTHAPSRSLHGVHFYDAKEGWAVGDEGLILHTIDGGDTWEPQTSGTKASLRGVTFLDESIGWAVGREERPYGGGSVGVVLFTRDGGIKWQRLLDNSLPGLSAVRFAGNNVGFLMGDGADPFASGLFRTTDGGKSWIPVKGTRTPAWSAGDFQDAKNGVLVGPGGKLSTYRDEQWAYADPAILAGRGLRAVQILHRRLVAAGEGGLVLTSTSGGHAWAHADIKLDGPARVCVDFNAIAAREDRVWIVGRPGSIVVRSDDGGVTWTTRKTVKEGDTPVSLNALHFLDKNRGWAVGALGVILATQDGGDTWTVQRTAPRTDVMVATLRPESLPVDVLVALAGGERRPPVAISVTHDQPDARDRVHLATRAAGGFAGEQLSALPLPQYLHAASRDDIIAAWNRVHAGDSPREVLRQLVFTIRLWGPTVVATDHPSGPAELLAEALVQAVKLAEDPEAFPEQLSALGLKTRKTPALFALADDGRYALDTFTAHAALEGSAREASLMPRGIVAERPVTPGKRAYVFLGQGAGPASLLAGTTSTPLVVKEDSAPAKAVNRTLVQLVEHLPRSEVVLTQLAPMLKTMPEDDAARAAFEVATAYVRLGEWDLAREVYLMMIDRSPGHPLSAVACRWLVQHNVSTEVRRRHELKQFAILVPDNNFKPLFKSDLMPTAAAQPLADLVPSLAPQKEARTWSQGCLEINKRFALFGSLTMNDPRVSFNVQTAQRQLGQPAESRAYHERFAAHVARGPWAEASTAELWITGSGPKPRKVAGCRLTDERPFLDGKLDDACWVSQLPMPLADAAGASQADSPTAAWLAYDAEFLYVAVRCKHTADRTVPAVKTRTRDANLDAHDRVSLLLDLDRDYTSYYRLEVDQRGCVRDDCWGDAGWNPKWYVAVHQSDEFWSVEAAIPLGELTSNPVTLDSRWACNIVRILPGRGVQSVSQPADVEPRPEGMCVLQFQQDAARKTPPMPTAK